MKKVLILTAGFGEGHNTAARNICAALEDVSPGEVDARVLDMLEKTFGRVNELVRRAYLATINHAPHLWEKIYAMLDNGTALQDNLQLLAPLGDSLKKLLEEEQPYAVVSTYPLYNYYIDQLYNSRLRPFSQVTVITDSISINSIWYRCHSDVFLVPNEDTATVLREAEIAPEKVHVLGFPVDIRFSSLESTPVPPTPGEKWRVLYVINSGKKEAPHLVSELLKIPEIDLQVTVGKDEELRRAVDHAITQSGRCAEVYGWTREMPNLMAKAHFIISKAGGATVQETLAAKTPLIMTQVVPGQEEGNARLLLENECGALATTTPEIVSTLSRAIENGGTLWRKWSANIERISRPDASREIARFVMHNKCRARSLISTDR